MAPTLPSGLSANRRRRYFKPGTPLANPPLPGERVSDPDTDPLDAPVGGSPVDTEAPAPDAPAGDPETEQGDTEAPAPDAPAGDAEPDQGDAEPEVLPEGLTKVIDILAWVREVEDQEARAQAALDAENAKPEKDRRSTLVAELTSIILG